MSKFKDLYSEGLNLMKEGQWKEARKKFDEAIQMKKGDGPTMFLME